MLDLTPAQMEMYLSDGKGKKSKGAGRRVGSLAEAFGAGR